MDKLILVAGLILLLCSSCTQTTDQSFVKLEPSFELSHSDLQEPITLQGEYILDEYSLNPTRILAVGNYLFLTNANSTGDQLLTCFNLQTDSVTYSTTYGEGPLEMQSIYSMQHYGDSLFLYDRTLKKGLVYSISQFSHAPIEPMRSIRFDEYPRDVAMLSDGSFIATSYYAENLKRIWHYNREGIFQRAYFSYPNTRIAGIDSLGIPEVYVSNMTVNHKIGKFAVANQNQDLIEIYSEDFEVMGYIYGPDLFIPAYELEIKDGMRQLWPIDEEIRDAYFSIQSSDKEIFVLYSGEYPFRKGEEQKMPGHLNKLFVFDWQGRFLRNYILDIPIKTRMSVDFENKKIYGISDIEDTKIVRFDF
jgi:hypothetical protein